MSQKRNKRQAKVVARKQHGRGSVNLRQRLAQAVSHHQRGELPQAERIYREILERQPDNVDALHYYGVLQYRLGNREPGIAKVRRCLAIQPDYVDASNNLGNIYKLEGKLAAAEKLYQDVLSRAPDATDAMVNLGVLARSRQQYEQAEAWYRQAIGVDARHRVAHTNLGNLLASRGRNQEALEAYTAALALHPDRAEAEHLFHRRADLLHRLDRRAEAIELYREWLRRSPDNATVRHMIAALTGENVPDKPGQAYIRSLFDRFAQSFDEVLDNLGYQAPALVGAAALRCFPDADRTLSVLDAGCGTGLCGQHLRAMAATLSGVDLSAGMLQRARLLGSYDELTEADLLDFLQARTASYDLVVSADTFCYFGALDTLIRLAAASLTVNGCLVFTVESSEPHDPADFVLNYHGRYSHSQAYVEAVVCAASLELREMRQVVLRSERGAPVDGLLVAALKPA